MKEHEDSIIQQAIEVLSRRFTSGQPITCPKDFMRFVMLRLAELENEQFFCAFLNSQHQIISFESVFTGTIDSCSVYPREVVRRSLQVNAAAVIFAHNHPSGSPEPSQADERITYRLRDALALVDIRVLDHVVVGGAYTVSMAERGLI